jgi:hypothetical protein
MEEFEGAGILASIFVSGIGFVFFSYGKKMTRVPQMLGGICLLAFPYFVSSALATLAIGALLIGAIILALRLGY